MHNITRKVLWIITFMTLLLDLLAENLTESSQSKVNISKSNNTLSVNSYDYYYTHPFRITAVVVCILWVIVQICYFGICETRNTRDRIYVWCFWHIPRYVISRMHQNLRRLRTRNREAHTNENVVHAQQDVHTQQVVESEV